MAELALYRKYRSGDFSEVIGQDHVVKTLTAALASGRLRHAYLFTGPRGVGKTSVARLLARALNCTGNPKPCNHCDNCLTALNSSLDIIEMDAASNRSIDSVRDLREKVGLAPSQGRFKVYIIDEVHMLTTEAFNALLKTLEEPPAHAVFILATTEAHKLPETIVSRTQAFNFKPITTEAIAAHLGKIAAAEKIDITPDALDVIAVAARGGFRDAISLLDQLSGSGAQITAAAARDLLGYTASEEVAALSQALAARDTSAALGILARLEAAGAQAGLVATQLAMLWRSVLLVSCGAATDADDVVKSLAASVPPERSAEIIASLTEIVRSGWPQLALEAAVVRLTVPAATSPTAPAPVAAPVAQAAPSAPASAPVSQAAPAKPVASKAAPKAGTTPDHQLWPKVMVLVKSYNNSLAALLQMYPVEFSGDDIIILSRFNFHRDLFLKPANRTAIENASAKVYGRQMRVMARTDETGKTPRRSGTDTSSELVSSALEILGGEIVD